MSNYGTIKYDDDGKPICHICGKSFHRVMSHARQKHKISAYDYKKQFGLNTSKSIASEQSKQKSHNAVINNYGKVVEKNLIKNGVSTRYKKGHEGRTKQKLSEQERRRLVEYAKTNVPTEKRKELGRKLGKSGKGNEKRWGTTDPS